MDVHEGGYGSPQVSALQERLGDRLRSFGVQPKEKRPYERLVDSHCSRAEGGGALRVSGRKEGDSVARKMPTRQGFHVGCITGRVGMGPDKEKGFRLLGRCSSWFGGGWCWRGR